jgi:hypothetical protein
MRKNLQPAIKKRSGAVVTAPKPAHHKDIAAKDKKAGGSGKGKRGFVVFVDRQEAKPLAGKKAPKGKRGLHSEDLYK